MISFKNFKSKLFNQYDTLFKKVDSRPLGLFRIFYGIIYLLELYHILKYSGIYFYYAQNASRPLELLVIISIITACLLILGAGTKVVVWLNYLLSVILIEVLGNLGFEYHVHYAYLGINFLLLFTPVSRTFSLDNIIKIVKFDLNADESKNRNSVYKIHYYIIHDCPNSSMGQIYFQNIISIH
jgi:hypothetical protein